MILLRLGMLFVNKLNWDRNIESSIWLLLLKALTLANGVRFFLLPVTIWNNHIGEMEKQLNFTLVMAYFVYAMIHVYSGMATTDYIHTDTHSPIELKQKNFPLILQWSLSSGDASPPFRY